MLNRRLLFTVVIKLLTLTGLLLLTIVFINSLFIEEVTNRTTAETELATVTLDISTMYKGQILKSRLDNREVAILFRQFPEKLEKHVLSDNEDLHTSLKSNSRSINADYFVFYNLGDSKNCPLFYAAGEFKDICSLNKFDEAGRDINDNPEAFKLKIPPHYFDKNTVIFGRWR